MLTIDLARRLQHADVREPLSDLSREAGASTPGSPRRGQQPGRGGEHQQAAAGQGDGESERDAPVDEGERHDRQGDGDPGDEQTRQPEADPGPQSRQVADEAQQQAAPVAAAESAGGHAGQVVEQLSTHLDDVVLSEPLGSDPFGPAHRRRQGHHRDQSGPEREDPALGHGGGAGDQLVEDALDQQGQPHRADGLADPDADQQREQRQPSA